MTAVVAAPAVRYLSASQIETFDLCNRKWWFDKILKLPSKKKSYFAFGTCLHECLERWILSTANGRVPDDGDEEWGKAIGELVKGKRSFTWTSGPFRGQIVGSAVELFPKNFETVVEKDGSSITLTPNEARQIKKLVAQAIERGIVTKGDNVFVEQPFELDLIEGAKIVGRLDLMRLADIPEIHDHKSFGKSSTRYLKQPGPKRADGTPIPIVEPYQEGDGSSPNCVGHVQQNLTYAWAYSKVANYKGPVLVRHNQFPKFEEDKGVRHVEALLSPKRLQRHEEDLKAVAKRMLRVAKIKRWEDTPPPSQVTACSDFGGCDFQDICGRRTNPTVYSQRVNQQNQERSDEGRLNLPLDRKVTKGNKNMAAQVFKRKPKEEASPAPSSMPKSGAFGGKGKAKAKPEPEEEEEVEEEAPAKPKGFNGGTVKKPTKAKNGAPWANADCPACVGVGMNSKGAGCPICDKTAQKRGVPTSAMYEIEATDNGYRAVAREEHEEAIGEMDAPNSWEYEIPAKGGAAPKAASAFGKARAAAKPEPEEEEEPEAEEVEEAPVKPKGKFGKGKPKAEPEPEEEEEEVEEEPEEAPAKPKGKFARRQAAADPEEEPEVEEAAQDEQEPAPARRGPGRPKGSKNRVTLEREGAVNQGGRPRAGITLCMAATIVAGPERPTMLAQALLELQGAEMAQEMGAESYWELDPRKRQDRLKQAGADIAASLGRTIVIFPGGTNDFDLVALFNGLAPHAELVIEGLR